MRCCRSAQENASAGNAPQEEALQDPARADTAKMNRCVSENADRTNGSWFSRARAAENFISVNVGLIPVPSSLSQEVLQVDRIAADGVSSLIASFFDFAE